MPQSSRPNGLRPRSVREFLEMDAPRVIAHRGLSGLCPENTCVAFRRAIEAGAHMIELDVLLSADDQPVVFHDGTLDRTTDGSGPVHHRTLAELEELDAGSWFSEEFAGERIPTLEAVLESIGDRSLLNVEIKKEVVTEQVKGGITDRVIRLLRGCGLIHRALLSCFDPRALLHARELEPRISRASLYDPVLHSGRTPRQMLEEAGAVTFNLGVDQVTAPIVDECHRLGCPVMVYTVNEPGQMRRLIDMGVDGLFTDRADVMLELIR